LLQRAPFGLSATSTHMNGPAQAVAAASVLADAGISEQHGAPSHDSLLDVVGTVLVEDAGGSTAVPASAAAQDRPSADVAASQPDEPPVLISEHVLDDVMLGTHIDPEHSFQVAHEAAKVLRDTFAALRTHNDVELADVDGVAKEQTARDLQLHLLSLRRAHRAMAKVAEVGRSMEAAARRVADAEFAHLETRRYESACCRAAARRCRGLPTPSLSEVRPWLDGRPGQRVVDDPDDEDESDENGTDGEHKVAMLTQRLDAEDRKRAQLAQELADLEKQKALDIASFKERGQLGCELSQKLKAVEVAFEPVLDLLELRARRDGAQAGPLDLSHLPTPLRLVYRKFDVLASFGPDAGVFLAAEAASIGADSEPPAKRPRVIGGSVSVGISPSPGESPAVTMRFRHATTENNEADFVTVQCEDCSAGDGVLDGMYPEDDGQSGPLVTAADAANLEGRPYAWAQVLAGLRERTATLMPASSTNPLASGEAVTATDVVQRVRRALAK